MSEAPADDDEVVEYALARTTSPTLVGEYQTMLPPKALLLRKLHELYARLAPEVTSAASAEPASHRPANRKSPECQSAL